MVEKTGVRIPVAAGLAGWSGDGYISAARATAASCPTIRTGTWQPRGSSKN